jgi:rSAM/selenodomain-associated transferase 1
VSHVRIVLFTRYPEPGKAKTRLIPALGADGAAALHRRLTERTLAAVRASGLRAEVRATGAELPPLADWLGDDLTIVDQGSGDLGKRLKRAAPPYPVLFIGADAPDLTPGHLREAAEALEVHDVVIGPAEDGGYWAIGLAAQCDFLFNAMPWGSEHVLRETLARLRYAGIAPRLLPTLADLDRPEDLARWPELCVGLPRD